MPQNTQDQIMERRQKVARMYLQGQSQYDIGEEVGVDQSQVSRDLKAIREQWHESTLCDFNDKVAEELAKIDEVERQAWIGWFRSCEDAVQKKKSRGGDDGDKAEVVTKGQSGNPRFLEIIDRCIERRCKIVGLEAPAKIVETDSAGNDLPIDVRRNRLLGVLSSLRDRAGNPADRDPSRN